jgi:hypothetical protein
MELDKLRQQTQQQMQAWKPRKVAALKALLTEANQATRFIRERVSCRQQ